MKLAVSAIAWDVEDEDEAFAILNSSRVKFVECVPARLLADPRAYRAKLESFSLQAVACQALLFGTSNLHLFQDEESRSRLLSHLMMVTEGSATIGANTLVFGSPKNRWIDGLISNHQRAFKIAELFFRQIGNYCANLSTTLCIEPNPIQYGCNFLTDSISAAKFVKLVASPGIKLNFDLGTSIINSELPMELFGEFFDQIGHVHISEPNLVSLNVTGMFAQHHKALAKALKENCYKGVVSIEMSKPKTKISNWHETLRRSIAEVGDAYIA